MNTWSYLQMYVPFPYMSTFIPYLPRGVIYGRLTLRKMQLDNTVDTP